MAENSERERSLHDAFIHVAEVYEPGILDAYRELVVKGAIKEVSPEDILDGPTLSRYENDLTHMYNSPAAREAELFTARHRQALQKIFKDAENQPVTRDDILDRESRSHYETESLAYNPRVNAVAHCMLIRHDRAILQFGAK